jgi:hypothetical protein
MACTATIDMSGLGPYLDTMNGHLADITLCLAALSGATTASAVATLIGDIETPLQKLGTAIVASVLQANTTGDPADLITALNSIKKAILADGQAGDLARRIAPPNSPSLANRLVNWEAGEDVFDDVGSVADRLAPLPTDVQCNATDLAWSTMPGSQNIAEQVFDSTILGYPWPITPE